MRDSGHPLGRFEQAYERAEVPVILGRGIITIPDCQSLAAIREVQ